MSMRSRSSALIRMAPLVAACLLLTLGSAAPGVAASGEVEPNDTAAQAQLLTLPVESTDEFVGTIDVPGDVDWFGFDVPQHQEIRAQVQGYTATPLDPVISLRAPDLSVLDARAGNGDLLSGYASSAGRYYLRVNDASATTSGQRYLLTVSSYSYPPQPTPLYPAQEYDLARTRDWPRPDSVEVADVTGDGHRDVLISTFVATLDSRPALYLLPGVPGGGLLGAPRRWLLPALQPESPSIAMGITTGDVIGDSRVEVVLATEEGVQLFVQGGGTLTKGTLVKTPYAVDTVHIADMDRDGRRDIVASTTRGVLVLQRTATGFAVRTVLPIRQARLRVVDVAGSLRPDLVGYREQDDVRVYRQRDDGTFAPPTVLALRQPEVNTVLDGLAVADVTGDGRRDVIAQSGRFVNIFARTSSGWSAPHVMTVGNTTPVSEAVDITGDGRPELIGTANIFFLDASGGLQRILYFGGQGRGPDALSVVDLTGDGRPDLVSAGREGPFVARNGFTP
jgi:FG-GAP-like repeat